MGFSEKAKHYFYEQLGMNNRQIAKQMDNYNEVLVSRYLNDDKISPTFINKIKKYFPQADLAALLSDEDSSLMVANEAGSKYKTRSLELVEEIEERLSELKSIVSRS